MCSAGIFTLCALIFILGGPVLEETFTHSHPSWSSDILYQLPRSTTNTNTHTFNGLFSGTTRASRYQKGKTNLDFTEARDGEWQWLSGISWAVCTSLQTDNHASTPPLSFLPAGCPSCCPTNSVKALKANPEQRNRKYSLTLISA